ncbi:melanocyte-stimulating hormone receptor-like [Pocillopora verrucosa]|uniref:melanocyte-stimulating hormone receptor-like n=1 Tax=Pocillopora verrucosa TaxID=203993 RepID=UPI003340657E
MATTNITGRGTLTQTFDRSLCSPIWLGEFKQQSISFSAVNILLSITAILGNSLILVALHKESSLHPPSKLLYRCLATTDLLVGLITQPIYAAYWMSLVHEQWSICQFSFYATGVTGYALCTVSMLTLTTISVDRLLAMLLGLRYKEIVTLRRTYNILAIFWIVSLVSGFFFHLNNRITFWFSVTGAPLCIVISIASYTKIFRAISHHQAQIQDYAQQQPSQPNALIMARYRKAVYSALWVQLVLVVCYVPNMTVEIVISKGLSNFMVIRGMTNVLVFFNSTLNPFLYCWKISEVRRAVKQTIRQAICYA